MTQEDKELLLKDLCARLPYKVKVCLYEKETCSLLGIDGYEVYLDVDSDSFRIESIKPYLRPMSSMTEWERNELSHYDNSVQRTDFFYSHHIDCRFMIEKDLGLEAPDDMYKIKEK